jgi:hypothetical protein
MQIESYFVFCSCPNSLTKCMLGFETLTFFFLLFEQHQLYNCVNEREKKIVFFCSNSNY